MSYVQQVEKWSVGFPVMGKIIPRRFQNPISREKLMWEWKHLASALKRGGMQDLVGQMVLNFGQYFFGSHSSFL